MTRAPKSDSRARYRRRLSGSAVGLLVGAVALVGCSEEVPTDYTSADRDAFLTACASPLDDPRLLSDVCVCVYDRLESEISFNRFVAISENLAAAASGLEPGPMPEELTEAVADCIVSEADL